MYNLRTLHAVSSMTLPPFSVSTVKDGEAKVAECPLEVDDNRISTPIADVILENGRIVSYKTKRGLEVVSDGDMPLNTFYFGGDIPNIWDNWDIDYDQVQKMNPIPKCISSEVVSSGTLQLRIRVKYQFGDSKLCRILFSMQIIRVSILNR